MKSTPQVGDIVIYQMPKEWQPGLGIRYYPAIVLYRNSGFGIDGVDVQVFCDPYTLNPASLSNHTSARRGSAAGEYQPRH